MSIKYAITFSNHTDQGIEHPELTYNQSVIEYVTGVLAAAAPKNEGYTLDNCTAFSVYGMYKGKSVRSFRLEYIVSVPIPYSMRGYALWIKNAYKQESVLLETYANGEYKAELIFDIDNIIEL